MMLQLSPTEQVPRETQKTLQITVSKFQIASGERKRPIEKDPTYRPNKRARAFQTEHQTDPSGASVPFPEQAEKNVNLPGKASETEGSSPESRFDRPANLETSSSTDSYSLFSKGEPVGDDFPIFEQPDPSNGQTVAALTEDPGRRSSPEVAETPELEPGPRPVRLADMMSTATVEENTAIVSPSPPEMVSLPERRRFRETGYRCPQ